MRSGLAVAGVTLSSSLDSVAFSKPKHPGAGAQIFLVDNGSLASASAAMLRRIASRLGRRLGRPVAPISVLHSSAIPANQLGGRKAEIFEPAIRRRARVGQREFLVIPLFFGPSRAITEYLPARARHLRRTFSQLQIRIAAPLVKSGDDRVASILERLVRSKLTRAFLQGRPARVALVDHGSPVRSVTRIRDRLAAQLQSRLGNEVEVKACSMERRPGRKYAFNDPLLADVLSASGWRDGPVVVAQLFLLPGRHAGRGGDIARICRMARARHPRLRIATTSLLGAQPGLIDILADRVAEAN